MEKIAIMTDSCADIPQEYINQYPIFVLPIIIQCENKEYKDGIDIHSHDVYKLQQEHILKTASPAGGDIVNTFETMIQEGYTHVIAIMLSAGLSGTYNEVRLLSQIQENLEIEVFDSKSGSIGYGSIAIELAKACQNGASFEQLKQKAQQLILDTHAFFSINTLEYLQKGGRIGKATAFVGTTLNIKPILSFDKETGEINVPTKVRGEKKVSAKLIQLVSKVIEENPQRSFTLIVADGEMRENRDAIEKELRILFPQCQQFIKAEIGAALSCYLGKGLLGAGVQFIE